MWMCVFLSNGRNSCSMDEIYAWLSEAPICYAANNNAFPLLYWKVDRMSVWLTDYNKRTRKINRNLHTRICTYAGWFEWVSEWVWYHLESRYELLSALRLSFKFFFPFFSDPQYRVSNPLSFFLLNCTASPCMLSSSSWRDCSFLHPRSNSRPFVHCWSAGRNSLQLHIEYVCVLVRNMIRWKIFCGQKLATF